MPETDFRLLFESAPGAMLVVDRELCVVAASELYLASTRTERDDLIGRHVFEAFSGDGGEASARTVVDVRASFERVFSEGVVDVLPIQRYDIAMPGSTEHEVRFWSALNSPVFASDESVAFVTHHVEDITETVKSEAAYRLLADHSTDVITRVSPEGIFRYVSPSSERVTGWRSEDLLGKNAKDFFHADDIARMESDNASLVAGADAITNSFRARHVDGHDVWVETTSQAVRGLDGRVLEIQTSTRDITVRKEVQESLRRSESLHRMLTENLPDASVFLLDHQLCIQVAEGEGMRQLPWFEENMFQGRKVTELYGEVPEEVLALVIGHYKATLGGERRAFELESSGMTFAMTAVPVHGDGGTVEFALVVARDVTRRKAAERQQRAVAHLGQVALSDREVGAVLEEAVNIVAETLGVELCGLLQLDLEEQCLRPVASVGLREGLVPPEGLPYRSDGQDGWAVRTGAPVVVANLATESRFRPSRILLDHGIVSGMTVVVEGRERPFGTLGCHTAQSRVFGTEDVHFLSAVAHVVAGAIERDRELQASRTAALSDALTGLPNRMLTLARLSNALNRRRRDGTNVAALVLDLDRFKVINDSLGHAAGDAVLRELGQRLSEAMREGDTVARLGGDEFVIVCDAPAENRDVIMVAERALAEVGRSFSMSAEEHFLTASLGIAIADDKDDTAESLLRDADAAMHRANKRGPGQYEVFDARMRVDVISRLRIESELRRAIHCDELRVHYQPIVDINTHEPLSVEALVRWEHPEQGLVPPDKFIPIAEETGLIDQLGRWVLVSACKQVAWWQQHYDSSMTVSVNVSGLQLSDPNFAAQVAEVSRRTGLRKDTLRLEVTESVLIGEAESPATVLDKFREHGIQLILDDFGTGYSSLSYLKHFPLDGVKLDRAFVADLGSDPTDTAITKAIITMASELGMAFTAEGIETEAQCTQLRQLGCVRGQGYFFSRPLPADAMTAFLERDLGAATAATGPTAET